MPVTRCTSAPPTPRRRSASRRHSRESDGCRKRCSRPALQQTRSVGGADLGARTADEPRAVHEELADDGILGTGRGRDPGRLPCPAVPGPAGQHIERGSPGRILGQEASPRLFQAAQRLVERCAEGAVDGHDLAGGLHLRAERAVGAGELVEREARQLDDDVVEGRLERSDGRAGDRVGDLVQPPADGDLGRHAGDGVAGRLGGQRRRTAHPRVDLDDGVVRRIGRERELDVAAALHAERPDDVEGRCAQALVNGIRQRLDGGHDDRIAGVDTQRIDVLHGADRDARVRRVSHDLVLDLLPARQVALDHDLPDGAQAKARAHALVERLTAGHDATAGPAQREGGAHDGRQPDGRKGTLGRGRSLSIVPALHDDRGGVGLTDAVEQVAEALPVLGHHDGLDGGAQQAGAHPLQQARACHLHGQVQPGCARPRSASAVRGRRRRRRPGRS